MGLLDPPGLSKAAALNQIGLRANHLIQGLSLTAYGNSYLAYTGNAYRSYFDRVKAALGHSAITTPPAWVNAGIAGTLVADLASYAYGSFLANVQGGQLLTQNVNVPAAGTASIGERSGGFIILDAVANDAGFDGMTASGGTTAKSRAAASNNLEALIRILRSSQRIATSDVGITYTGTWTSQATQSNLGNTSKWTATQNSAASRGVTVGSGGTVSVVLLSIDDAVVSAGGAAYSVACTGKTTVTGTTSNQHRQTGAGRTSPPGPNDGFGHMVVPFTGLTPGSSVTITVTKTDAGSTQLWFGGLLNATATPPTILVHTIPYFTAAGYATYTGLGGVGASTTVADVYNALIAAVVAKFPNDKTVNLIDVNASGFDPTTMIGNADGASLHLNDLGNAFYAYLDLTLMNSLPPRNGLQFL